MVHRYGEFSFFLIIQRRVSVPRRSPVRSPAFIIFFFPFWIAFGKVPCYSSNFFFANVGDTGNQDSRNSKAKRTLVREKPPPPHPISPCSLNQLSFFLQNHGSGARRCRKVHIFILFYFCFYFFRGC